MTEIVALKLSPLLSSTWLENGFRRSWKATYGKGECGTSEHDVLALRNDLREDLDGKGAN